MVGRREELYVRGRFLHPTSQNIRRQADRESVSWWLTFRYLGEIGRAGSIPAPGAIFQVFNRSFLSVESRCRLPPSRTLSTLAKPCVAGTLKRPRCSDGIRVHPKPPLSSERADTRGALDIHESFS